VVAWVIVTGKEVVATEVETRVVVTGSPLTVETIVWVAVIVWMETCVETETTVVTTVWI